MWKKKYFQEKKKTSPVDDRSTQLKADLDLIHDKIIQIIDNESKHSGQVGVAKEAEIGVRKRKFSLILIKNLYFFLKNLILQKTRAQYEIENIRHQIDQAKLKLTTDIKVILSN